jgi:hypothetical protein
MPHFMLLLVLVMPLWRVLHCSSTLLTPRELPAGPAAILGCPVLPHVGYPVGGCMGAPAMVVLQGSPAGQQQASA